MSIHQERAHTNKAATIVQRSPMNMNKEKTKAQEWAKIIIKSIIISGIFEILLL